MEFVEHLKSSVDIVQVVGQYVRLKRQGSGPRYSGLCPFHSEKTPSFSVHSQHQFFKCFGCGEGGDVITFIMKIDGMTFWEAVTYLAERQGIPMPKRSEWSDEEAKKRGGILEMHVLAAESFHQSLLSPAGAEARSYLERRGLSRASAEEFMLGLSDRGGQALVRLFEKKGYSREDMLESGLVLQRADGSGLYDRFRGRLMFPIHSEAGKIIAFGGRALAEGDEPKYLNSSETAIYVKSHVLYNLNRARKAIQDAGFSVLVEGYMDVIGVYAAGVKNVVATCGTALTNSQVRALRRHAGQLVLNFDPDNAGANATERSIPILLEENMNLKVLRLPDGLDPDEFIQRHGADAYQNALRTASSYYHWLADRARSRFDMKTPDGRVAAFQFLLPSILKMPDRLSRLAVADDLAEYLNMPHGVVLEEFKRAATERRQEIAPAQKLTADPAEVLLLHAILKNEEARSEILPVLRRPAILERLQARPIFETLLRLIDGGEQPSFSALDARLEGEEKALLVSLAFADDTLSNDVSTEQAVACVQRLAHGERQARRDVLRRRIKDAERAGEMQQALQLMQELTELEHG